MKGDIIHDASLSIEAGAHFEGQVRRSEKEAAPAAKPAAKAANSGNGKDAEAAETA